jgi:putative FmdB family regulatory protein
MPLYEYYCKDCHGVFELLRPTREAGTAQPCPECDEDAKRIVSNFEAYIFREGLARKIPDDGTYWHVETKVARPMTESDDYGQHPDLKRAAEGPTAVPTMEEFEGHQAAAERFHDDVREQEETGSGFVTNDVAGGEHLEKFRKRVRVTARRERTKRRRRVNSESTPRTASGKHVKPSESSGD